MIAEHATNNLNAANLPNKDYKHKRKSGTREIRIKILLRETFLWNFFCFHTCALDRGEEEKTGLESLDEILKLSRNEAQIFWKLCLRRESSFLGT